MNGILKMLLRTLSRNKLFSIINIVGLSAGLAVAMLIFMLVYNELSFDRSFPDYKRIYRVNTVWQDHRLGTKTGMTPVGIGPIIKGSVPGVEAVVRGWNRGHIVKTETYEKDMRTIFVEPGFFDLFPTPVLYGSFEDALSRPNGVALSETQAAAMYGEGDPVGKTYLYGSMTMEVRAVFRDYPTNTSMARPIYSSFPVNYDDPRMQRAIDIDTFLLLDEQTDPAQVADRLNEIAADVFKDLNCTFELMPLKDFHLRPNGATAYRVGNSPGDLTQVRIFSILAVVILLIVCINYMNLSTAQAQKRLREIGLNKILGAQRSTIVWRSYLESAILTFVAFVIAFGLFYLLLPDFSNLMGVQLSYAMIGDPKFLSGLAAIFLFTVLFSASYSAWYLSGFPPALAVKKGGATYKILRQVLSVAQFAVAITLITWVIVIETQTRYIYSKDLGYNPDELVGFWIRTARTESDYTSFEDDLRRLSSVREVSRVPNFPAASEIVLRKNPSDEGVQMKYWPADEHIVDLLQLKVIAGRALPAPMVQTDTVVTVMLNRRAAAYLGMTPEEVVGQRIYIQDGSIPTTVCGVVEDFNFESLYHPVAPAAFVNMPSGRFYQIVRMAGGNRAENVAVYKQLFESHFPNDMFDPHYIKEELDGSNYGGVQKTERIIVLFTLLAIFMACMGVFALTAFLVEQRTKEIGIRRVLGSSVGGILGLFARTYLKLLGIALLIAIPAGMFVCNHYLTTFAYHIRLSWWMFAAAAGITLGLVLIAVVAPTFRAANADPVKNLQYE